MSTYDYLFNDEEFAQAVSAARVDSGRKWSQSDLASMLSTQYAGVGAEIQLSTIKRIENNRGGVGILSALKVAKALDLPLPKVIEDERILEFSRCLLNDRETASAKCDSALFNAMGRGKDKWQPLVDPSGFLGLLPAFTQSSLPVRISIRTNSCVDLLIGGSGADIDCSGILPVDLVAIFEEISRLVSIRGREKKLSASARLSSFWRHIPTGASESIGVARLVDEISRFEALIKESELDLNLDLRHCAVVGFLNLLNLFTNLSHAMSHEDSFIEDYLGYIYGYTRLLRLTEKPYAFSRN